jgi:hypothetical protein
MDYVSRQFIHLTKKFRKELRLISTSLSNSLNKHANAISAAEKSAKNHRNSDPPKLIAELHEPETVIAEREAREGRREQREIEGSGRDRTRLLIETVGACTALLLVALTWISVVIARHAAITAEASAAASQAQADAALAQTKVAQQAAETNLESFRQEQRAWVSIATSQIKLSNEPNETNGCTLNLYYVNFGKTPAIDVWAQSAFSLSDAEPVIDNYVPKEQRNAGATVYPGSDNPGIVSEPHVRWECRPFSDPVSFANYKSGRLKLYWRARIFYLDIFKQKRETTLCFFHSYGWPLDGFVLCKGGNNIE